MTSSPSMTLKFPNFSTRASTISLNADKDVSMSMVITLTDYGKLLETYDVLKFLHQKGKKQMGQPNNKSAWGPGILASIYIIFLNLFICIAYIYKLF